MIKAIWEKRIAKFFKKSKSKDEYFKDLKQELIDEVYKFQREENTDLSKLKQIVEKIEKFIKNEQVLPKNKRIISKHVINNTLFDISLIKEGKDETEFLLGVQLLVYDLKI